MLYLSMAFFATSSRGAFLPLPKRTSPLLASDESSSESSSSENDCKIVEKGKEREERNGASGRDFAVCAACGIPAELSAASLRTLRCGARGVAPVCAACVKEGKATKAGLVMAAVFPNRKTSLLAAASPDFPGTQVRIRVVGIRALSASSYVWSKASYLERKADVKRCFHRLVGQRTERSSGSFTFLAQTAQSCLLLNGY